MRSPRNGVAMKTQKQKRTKNREKGEIPGDLQPPNGERNRDSANTDLERSVAHHSHDSSPASASEKQPKWLESATKEQRAGYKWLITELKSREVEKPGVTRTSKGVWECRDGKRLLGRLSESVVIKSSSEAVDGLFDLISACCIELDTKDLLEKHEGILWAFANAITYGQREVVLALMRQEHKDPGKRFPDKVAALMEKREKKGSARVAVDETTYAYWVLDAAIAQWCANSKEARWKTLEIAGDIRAFASKQVADNFKQWHGKEQSKKCPPWFKAKSFYLPADALSLIVDGRDLTSMIRVAKGPQVIVKAYARGWSEWSTVRRVASGEYRKRSARVVWDENRRKWLIRISYSYSRPQRAEGDRILAIVPCMNSLVRAFTDEAKAAGKFDVPTMLAKKAAFDARRAEVRPHKNHLGKGACGHGKKRRWRLYGDLSTKEANFTTTWIRQQAAFVVKTAEMGGASMVILDDWSTPVPCFHSDRRLEKALRRFPICSLLDAIKWACEKAGIKCMRHQTTTECPCCGVAKDKIVPFRKWNGQQLLRCSECNTEFDEVIARAWRCMKAYRPEASKNFKDSCDQMMRIRKRADSSGFSEAAE